LTKYTILTVCNNGYLYEGKIDTKSGGQCGKLSENKLTLIGDK